MNSYKKLLDNSFIFAIGNFGSKIISFILLPIYTYFLTTEQFGTVDIVTTTITLLLPIISGNIFEAVLRFTMDKDLSREKVLSSSIAFSFVCILIILIFYPIFFLFNIDKAIVIYVYLILISQVFYMIFSQFTRAIGRIKLFAINGIIVTFIIGINNIVLLTIFHLGIHGYFISIILANVISSVFLFISIKAWKYLNKKQVDLGLIINMLKYSIPMIPNSIMWWLINASSRFFILFFVGASANGIFAVANRIPSLLNIISSVFTKAWQLSAIEEYDSENKSKFYSNIFNYYSTILFLSTSAIILITKPFMKFFVAPEYFNGWRVIPFLLLSVTFSSFSSFLGTNYLAAKQTRGVFKTSIAGGIISIILNFLLIPFFGILGASLSI